MSIQRRSSVICWMGSANVYYNRWKYRHFGRTQWKIMQKVLTFPTKMVYILCKLVDLIQRELFQIFTFLTKKTPYIPSLLPSLQYLFATQRRCLLAGCHANRHTVRRNFASAWVLQHVELQVDFCLGFLFCELFVRVQFLYFVFDKSCFC